MYRRLSLTICLLSFSLIGFSQFADCSGAFPVCGNGTIDLAPQGTGINDFADPDNIPPSCQFTESENVWIRIEIQQAGTLGFTIIPDDLTGPDRDDYDFAIYGPNRTCDNLGASIRCSSTNPQSAGVQAETGLNSTETETSEGPGAAGNGFVRWLENVQPQEFYYVLIDNFNRDAGFSLEFTGTALIEDRITKEDGGVDLGPDINLCDNETTMLTANIVGDADFLWSTGETTRTIEVDTAGEFTVTATNPSGCISEDAINVNLIPAPLIDQVNVNQNDICEPVSNIIFSSTGSTGNYEWFAPDGSSIGTGNDVTIASADASDSGTYMLQVSRDNGCEDMETIDLVIHPLPVLSINGNQDLCENDAATLSATGALSYQWIDPNGNVVSTTNELDFPVLDPADSGMYQLIGETEFNCEDTLLFDVSISPELTVDIQPDVLGICSTDPLDALAVSNQTGVNFVWTNPSGATVSTTDQLSLTGLTINDIGLYTVTATNASNCVAVDEVFVDIDESFLFENTVEQCPGTTFTIPQTGQLVSMSEIIQVDLLTTNGCDSTFIWDVQFLPCTSPACTGFPSAFAPNGNDENETFTALFSLTCIPDEFTMRIFNRWGEELLETNDFTNGWDGIFNGQLAQQGLYLWEVEFSFLGEDETVTREGGVTLIR